MPTRGPLVLVGNHPNGLVDPVLLSCATDRSLRFLGKAPLFQIPVVGWLVRGARVLPVHRAQDGADTKEDNLATFAAVFEALGDGDLVALFPEGKSHSEPKVQRMKTGAARMALGAEARHDFGLGIRVVPVGLVYRARRRFGSRAVVWVGPAIDVTDLAELHARDEWAAVEALTERIHQGLSELTLELEAWGELPLLEFVADLEAAPRTARFEEIRGLAHELAVAREAHPEEVIELAERARTLEERLERFGARPRDLALDYSWWGVARWVVLRALTALLLLPLAALGRVAWFVPWQIVGLVLRSRPPSVDVWATTAVLGGLLLFPSWLVAVAGLVAWKLGAAWGLGAAASLVATGLVALATRGFAGAVARDVRAFLAAQNRAGLRAQLAAERDDLVKGIESVRARVAARA